MATVSSFVPALRAAGLISKKQQVIYPPPWSGSSRRKHLPAGLAFFLKMMGLYSIACTLVWRNAAMMIHTADVQGLRQKINQLQTEHRDLDDVIVRLSQSTAQDQIQLQRLKKRKLLLKDQIAILERQLEPDIPA